MKNKWFFGWTNIKWLIKELINLYSKAICGSCQTCQLIPKNSTKFICFACRTICKCIPQKVDKNLL